MERLKAFTTAAAISASVISCNPDPLIEIQKITGCDTKEIMTLPEAQEYCCAAREAINEKDDSGACDSFIRTVIVNNQDEDYYTVIEEIPNECKTDVLYCIIENKNGRPSQGTFEFCDKIIFLDSASTEFKVDNCYALVNCQ